MLISETYIDRSRNVRYGDSGEYEPFTDKIGELFRSFQREYGRCTSKIYVDVPGQSQPMAIGWVFEQRAKYEDTQEPYIRETWITLHTERTTVTQTPHYHALRG